MVKESELSFKRMDLCTSKDIGEKPIPVINFDDGTSVALSDDELPLILPPLEDYSPSKSGAITIG